MTIAFLHPLPSTLAMGPQPDPEKNGVYMEVKHASSELVLVPQPSDDEADPLNWPLRKKCFTLGLVSACTLIGIAQTLANQSGFFQQAVAYHRTPNELSYSVCPASSPFPGCGGVKLTYMTGLRWDCRSGIGPLPLGSSGPEARSEFLYLLGPLGHAGMQYLVRVYDRGR